MNITDIFTIAGIQPEETKIHLATGAVNKLEPWAKFTEGTFKEWQEWQNSESNFKRPYILSLIFIKENEWLFAGFYKVLDCKDIDDHYELATEICDVQTPLVGRLIINFNKSFRASYLRAENHIDNMSILEVKRNEYRFHRFPGYTNVCISNESLKYIIQEEEPSWKTALSLHKGIYIITDTFNGKNYIGKADGENAIWQRWTTYANNGHGGNIGLKAILSQNGEDYVSNFQYSILEVVSLDASDDLINERESFWKDVFCTRTHGYNEN